MLIFVYGDDTFRAQEKVAELKAAFLKKFDPTGINVSVFPERPGGKINQAEALQAVCSLPFLTPRRMVIIRDLVAATKAGKHDADAWAEGLKRTPESTIVVLWESLGPKEIEKKALFKELKAGADVHLYAFPQLEGLEFSKWVATRMKERGGIAESDALRALVERVGPDLWQMDGEIQKLIAFSHAATITKAMVEDLVRPTFEGEIFALMDAVSQKRGKEAIKLLEQERSSGSDDYYLISMLSRQVRVLLGARSLLDENPATSKEHAAQELGVHPFVASKALSQARAFTLSDLRTAHELLFKYDLAMKSGQITPELAVDLVATKLME